MPRGGRVATAMDIELGGDSAGACANLIVWCA